MSEANANSDTIEYRYLLPWQCESAYPVVYYDDPVRRDPEKYLVLHEVYSRNQHNYAVSDQWQYYKGIVTWNPAIFEKYKDSYNMVYCRQYMNMFRDRSPEYVPWEDRGCELCCFYGNPASTDRTIMNARYDVPLALWRSGMTVDAYGVIPQKNRIEYRGEWSAIFRGGVPSHQKWLEMRNYKFSIAFENSKDPYWADGWVTEKIYDVLGSGTIPIYWGAPNIEEYVPADLFIHYQEFENPQLLFEYIRDTPQEMFAEMSRRGYEWHGMAKMDEYLDIYEGLA